MPGLEEGFRTATLPVNTGVVFAFTAAVSGALPAVRA